MKLLFREVRWYVGIQGKKKVLTVNELNFIQGNEVYLVLQHNATLLR